MPAPIAFEVRYAAGNATLLGAGSRWLLIDVADADDPHLETVWDVLTAPVASPDRVLAAVDEHYGPDRSLVLVDLAPGAETRVVRGSGRISSTDGTRSLRLGDAAPPGSRRLVSGIVAASGAELRPLLAPTRTVAATSSPTVAPTPGVIDGIPPEILSGTAAAPAADRPVEPAPAVAAGEPGSEPEAAPAADPVAPPVGGHTVRRTASTDHDGHTTHRPVGAEPEAPEEPEAIDHLQQSTHETVLAVHCPTGHPTPAFTASCRVCRVAVPPQEPHRMPRPRLGLLHLPDGTEVPLDRGVVFGRQPSATPGGEDWPQLVRLPADNTYVSRNHLHVELDGWLVLATDLGSRGGTTLRVPGRPAERIRAGERYIWEPGQVLDLADSFEISYEVR